VAHDAPRLLFDAHQLGRHQTGNETYVRALLREFAGTDAIELTALVERGALADPDVAAFARRQVPASGSLRLASMALAARRAGVDLVHAVYFAPYLSGVPVVLTVHDISYEIHPEFFSRTERWRGRMLIRDSARRARTVVTVSETSRRDIIERYGLAEDRVIAIHNGVSQRLLDVPAPKLESIDDRSVRLLALGTLQPRKNLARLVDAVRIASKTRPIQLRVVGPNGYQAEVIRQRLDGAAEVEVVGYVSEESLVDEYRRADMLVYPSLYEGFGLPVVEAMACGVPVITSTGGALPEVAGDAALIIDPLDEVAISEAILRLADDIELRRDLIGKGRVRARQFTWGRSAERHIQVYRDAAGG
jgi:glycosyltransferase involved in cell wall biosynthesis